MQLARVRLTYCKPRTISAALKATLSFVYSDELRAPPFVQYFGMKDQIFDLIDQSKLLPSQIKIMCEALLGCTNLPDPDVDPKAFIAAVDEQVALHPKVFDPPSGKMQQWIKTDVLKSRLK